MKVTKSQLKQIIKEELAEVTNMNRDLDKYKKWIDDIMEKINDRMEAYDYPPHWGPKTRDEVVEQWEAQDVVGDTLYDVFLKGQRADLVAMDWFTK